MNKKNLLSIILVIFFQISIIFENKCNEKNLIQNKIESEEAQKTIVIMLHLYNLDLMDEFITRINNFIAFNKSHNFYVKINIPIDINVDNFHTFDKKVNELKKETNALYHYCLHLTPYHSEKITHKNCVKLFTIFEYFNQHLIIDKEKIQIIFSENRGVDVGGFFLLLDQIINEKLKHDYIIKLHTKTHPKWRQKLLSILNLNLSKYIPEFDAIYASQHLCCNSDIVEKKTKRQLNKILSYFNLPPKDKFWFSAGTMFIASSKLTEFFQKYDRITLFNQLNLGYKGGIEIEHGYERFFGYLKEFLKLKTKFLVPHILKKELL